MGLARMIILDRNLTGRKRFLFNSFFELANDHLFLRNIVLSIILVSFSIYFSISFSLNFIQPLLIDDLPSYL